MKQFFLSPCPQARGLREGQMLLATLQPGKAFSVKDKQISGRLGEKKSHFASLPGSFHVFICQEPSLIQRSPRQQSRLLPDVEPFSLAFVSNL